uniref:Lck interacting transmembrane adaptor 1 n=1 Tax=Equus caballus TaxID=9796 RepID=F7D4I3_HORSE
MKVPFKVPELPGRPQGLRRCHHAFGLGQSSASQDGATGARSPSCPLGPGVPCPAPLAVGAVRSLPQSLLRRPHLCSLSKSDTRLHELHGGPRGSRALRPASMDFLRPQWLEESRGTIRPPAAFSHRELPQAPSISPEATYSNVGLASIPRASLAANPVVWAGARLTSSCARPGPEVRPVVAEYGCIQKLQGTGPGPQALEQRKAQVIPAAEVDILYSKVNKPKRRSPGPVIDQPDPKGRGAILVLGSDRAYEALPLRGRGVDNSLLENVYESIQEMGAPERLQPPSSGY